MFTYLARWLSSDSETLKKRAVRGGIWLFLGDAIARAASLLKLAILGRLLSPHDFGLMGIAILVLKWLEYFTETGFNAALIRKPGDIRPYLDTAWTIQILRSTVLALVLLLGAPVGAWFFGNSEATPIVRAVALVLLLRGLTNPAVVYLRKELDFGREVVRRLSGVVFGLFVAIPVAFVYRSVWALVLSIVAAQVAETAASYWVKPYRPRLALERARAGELVGFGKWIFWLNIVNFLGLYLDSIVVGKVLGAVALGFYQMAYQFVMSPTSDLGAHVGGVLFPALAKLQGTRDFQRAFLRTLALVSSVVIPIASFLTVFAEPFVRTVLGEKWVSTCTVLQILAWAGVATAVMAIANSVFHAMGKPNLSVRTSLLKVCLLAGALYPLAIAFKISGVAMAVTISAVVAMGYQLYLASRLIHLTGAELASTFKVGLLGSLPVLGAGFLTSTSLFLAAGVATGGYLVILVTTFHSHFGMKFIFSPSRRPGACP